MLYLTRIRSQKVWVVYVYYRFIFEQCDEPIYQSERDIFYPFYYSAGSLWTISVTKILYYWDIFFYSLFTMYLTFQLYIIQ